MCGSALPEIRGGEQLHGTDLGDDGGGSSNHASSDCGDLDHDCYRIIVVSDPDHASSSPSIDAWTTSLATFDAYNGLGQRGPGGGGNPFSPNGIRHGTDAGQPGGTPVFTTEVTPDMCAQIAACSGRLSKQAPIYIWDAPIDAWARTAVDVATDFVPGVAQAKTAYDAYERIQNGEDPVDVLMAAGGEAALGLKAGNKARKALEKAEDVADVTKNIRVSSSDFPETVGHIRDAQAAGKPSVLTIDRAGISGRRREALSGLDKIPGKQLDEYPPAMFREGGRGASVRAVRAGDNMGAGACIGNQCRGLPDMAQELESSRTKIMMTFFIDVSYTQLAVFVADLRNPFNKWTNQHIVQGFSWRPCSISFRTFDDGEIRVTVLVNRQRSGASTAQRIIQVPFSVPHDTTIEIGSISDSRQFEIPQGNYAVTFEHGHIDGGSMWCTLWFEPRQEVVLASVVRADPELAPGQVLQELRRRSE
jgi:Competence protein J (ComJ)/Deoxyribonuclease NucA/NucB